MEKMSLMKIIRTGETVPPIMLGQYYPWLMRSNPEAERDGWNLFGTGFGWQRFVYNNGWLEGMPRREGIAVPQHWQVNQTGVSAGGSLRYVGKFLVPPRLNKQFSFWICTSVKPYTKEITSAVRLFINGKFVAGHMPIPWLKEHNLIDKPIHEWPMEGIRGSKYPQSPPSEVQWWVELFLKNMDFEEEEVLDIVVEYQPLNGGNWFTMKNNNEGFHPEYKWGEDIALDLCYPDHVCVLPEKIKKGEQAMLSWYSSQHTDVVFEGKQVHWNSYKVVSPEKTTDYEIAIGKKKHIVTLEVE